jgi:hypothetical protein
MPMTTARRWVPLVALLTMLFAAGTPHLAAWAGAPAESDPGNLPRFSEEREAAARFFVGKHLPELLPLLDQLKKNNPTQYLREVREIFQVTEMLADLREDDPKRYELELKVWKAENRANTLVAQLSTPEQEARKKVEAQLQELAKELVELDMQVLELRAEQLDKELGEVKDELAKMRDNTDKQVKERYEGLLDKARRPKK